MLLLPSVQNFDNFSVLTVIHSQEFVNNKKVKTQTIIQKSGPPPQQVPTIKPNVPIEFWEFIHELSMFFVIDDIHDLGKFSYWNRNDHYYKFKKSPHHPSPFHHWQVGVIGLFLAQMGAAITKALDMKDSFEEFANEEPINITPAALPSNQVVFDRLTRLVDTI